MDEFEEQLRQFIAATCSHPRGSLERQKGLNEIIWRIQKSGNLLRSGGVPDYEDALQQTWLYFCRNLCEANTGDRYDPLRASVTTWINAYLKHRLSDRRMAAWKEKDLKAAGVLSEHGELLEPVDKLIAPPDPPPILEEIREWVEKEGSNLRRIHVRDRPDINCQVLILRRLPPETSWNDLSQEFGVAIATLSNFYQRKCFPRLLNFGKAQGYLSLP